MLILTRRTSEAIYIGDNITVTILGVIGNQVRLGIDAPRSVTVDRAEIRERKRLDALEAQQPVEQAQQTEGEPDGNR